MPYFSSSQEDYYCVEIVQDIPSYFYLYYFYYTCTRVQQRHSFFLSPEAAKCTEHSSINMLQNPIAASWHSPFFFVLTLRLDKFNDDSSTVVRKRWRDTDISRHSILQGSNDNIQVRRAYHLERFSKSHYRTHNKGHLF